MSRLASQVPMLTSRDSSAATANHGGGLTLSTVLEQLVTQKCHGSKTSFQPQSRHACIGAIVSCPRMSNPATRYARHTTRLHIARVKLCGLASCCEWAAFCRSVPTILPYVYGKALQLGRGEQCVPLPAYGCFVADGLAPRCEPDCRQGFSPSL